MAEKQKIRIRLKAYDHESLDSSTKKIVETVLRTQAKVRGPVPLPTERHRPPGGRRYRDFDPKRLTSGPR